MDKFVATTSLKSTYPGALPVPDYLKLVEPPAMVTNTPVISSAPHPTDEVEDMWDNVPI